MNKFNTPYISLLLSISLSVCANQVFANENTTDQVSIFIDTLPQDIESITPDYMEEAGNPYQLKFMNLVGKYGYQHDSWPIDAVRLASQYIRLEMCKEKFSHYIDFTKDIKNYKESGEPFSFNDIVHLNNGFYFVELPLTPQQRKHPYKGPIQIAFEAGWKHQGDYKIKEYFNTCLAIPISGYIQGFKKYGFSVGNYINL